MPMVLILYLAHQTYTYTDTQDIYTHLDTGVTVWQMYFKIILKLKQILIAMI